MTLATRFEKIKNDEEKNKTVDMDYKRMLFETAKRGIYEDILRYEKKINDTLPRTKSGRISFTPNDTRKKLYMEKMSKINELRNQYNRL
jgi:endo-1,4-beta-D-glucanase Y